MKNFLLSFVVSLSVIALQSCSNDENLVVPNKNSNEFANVLGNAQKQSTLIIGVFQTVNHKVKSTTADGFILQGNDTVKSFKLDDRVNMVSFNGNVGSTYKLVVDKDGFNPYAKEFVCRRNINPGFKVLLSPGFIMFTRQDVEFLLEGSAKDLKVDWGDGSEKQALEIGFQSHSYTSSTNHRILITGDIENISSFYAFYGQAVLDSINLQGLLHLQSFRVGLTHGPRIIDLSYCNQMQDLMVTGIFELEDLRISSENKIDFIDISGPNKLTTPDVDDVVNKIFHSAIKYKLTEGYFFLNEFWDQLSSPWVGPPSPSSLQKFKILTEKYQWVIFRGESSSARVSNNRYSDIKRFRQTLHLKPELSKSKKTFTENRQERQLGEFACKYFTGVVTRKTQATVRNLFQHLLFL